MAGRARKKSAWSGHSFRSMFSPQPKKIYTDKNEANSSERKCVAKETLVNGEKILVDGSTEEQVKPIKLEISGLIGESHDVGIDIKCGDVPILSKRKRDSCMDLDASSGCKTSNDYEICVMCSKMRRLCDGKYCKSSCQPSYLDPSTDDVPVGVWQCFQCLNDKMQIGAPLSETVEAIWNTRETEVIDAEGLRKEKQYFVKYRGRAHIHNQWIPESRLSLEAEKLIEEFNKQRETVKWNEEWVKPQRLLKKRLLLSPNQENNDRPGTSSCNYEWLVKWHGLDYESVTWESDTFLSSVHGANLIKDYENRHKKALDYPYSVDKDKNGSLVKLQELPAGSPPGVDASNLETVNKLREFTHEGQSAVVFDDEDRVKKMLLYVVSLSDICHPFLIVTTSSLLPVWEAEFLRAVPSVDIVVYNGSSDNRKCVRTLEFYDDDGRIMLQVLLSSVEIVAEDFLFLDSIKWKVVIVDECQQLKVSSQFARIKMLAADVKILLYSGALKDNVTEYLNLLSLLESCGDSINVDALKAESFDNICKLRERLSKYIASEGKPSSSKFVEFWVPSIISNVQLEQYCDTLLSNSISLCSYSRTDPVGALQKIVFSTRKSCDHPYIVDPSLKRLITKDLPPISFLDAEIKASGKLQLLEMILSEIRKRQLRVLILFQMPTTKGTSMQYTIRQLYSELDETFRKHLNESQDSRCLLNLLRFPAAYLMPSLLCYFLEFYNTKDNVFCFNGQVLSISLEDVLFLTGLPIDGDAVIDHHNRDSEGFHRVFKLDNEKSKSTKVLKSVAKDVSSDNDARKKAVLLLIIRCFIVPSSNGGRVSTTYLRYIEDLSRVDSYAWGAALLAVLYHGIAEWKKETTEKKTLEGNAWVILSFFILRIPKLREQLSINLNVDQLQVPFMPPIVNQVERISHNHRADFKDVLDNIFLNLSHDDVKWTPYVDSYHPQQRLGTRIGPIICNNFVVHHQPHIAYNQFPIFKQYCCESLDWKPHKIKFKRNNGSCDQDLIKNYQKEFDWWKAKKLAQELMKEKSYIIWSTSKRPRNRSAPSPPPRCSPPPYDNIEDSTEAANIQRGANEERDPMEIRVWESLKPCCELDADVIYLFVSFLNRTMSSKAFSKSLLLKSYIYGRLDDDFQKVGSGQIVTNKMKWWKGDFNEYSYILFPICTERHFSLAIVCFSEKRERKILILHLDSYGTHPSDVIFNTIVWSLKQKWEGETSDFPPIVTKTVEVPQQPNPFDCGLFVMHMMKCFLELAPERFKNDNLKMFGTNWFDPQDACALRGGVKPIIQEELNRYLQKPPPASRTQMFDNSFCSPPFEQQPTDDDKQDASAQPPVWEKKYHDKISLVYARKILKKPVDIPAARGRSGEHGDSPTCSAKTPVENEKRKLRSSIKTLHGQVRRRKEINYADIGKKPSKGYKLYRLEKE